MKASLIMFLVLVSSVLFSGCASSYASKCSEWFPYTSYPELKFGVVERHDIYRCVRFNEVP